MRIAVSTCVNSARAVLFKKERKNVIDPFKKKLSLLFEEKVLSEEQAALKEIEDKESSQVQGGTLPEKTRRLLGIRKRAQTLTNEQQTTIPAREDKPFKNEQERIAHAASLLRYEGN